VPIVEAWGEMIDNILPAPQTRATLKRRQSFEETESAGAPQEPIDRSPVSFAAALILGVA